MHECIYVCVCLFLYVCASLCVYVPVQYKCLVFLYKYTNISTHQCACVAVGVLVYMRICTNTACMVRVCAHVYECLDPLAL